MKNIILLLLTICFFACSNNNKNIKGSISNAEENTVLYLEELFPESNPILVDSCSIKDGEFSFNVNEENIGIYKLYQSPSNFAILIFKQGDKINLDLDINNLNSYYGNGSIEIEAYLNILSIADYTSKKIDTLRIIYEKAEGTINQQRVMDSIRVKYDQIMIDQQFRYIDFIKQNSGNFASFFALMNIGSIDEHYDIYKMVIDSLEINYAQNEWTKSFKETLESVRATAIGSVAPDFTINDVNNNPFTLSSLRGSYVLIDFWASWCKPCRDENPNIVRMYDKYREKGFEIVGISLDDTLKNNNGKERWINAIEQDKIEWIQVSELCGFESKTPKSYGINSIPATFLIDKNGVIIDKNLRGTKLNQKLSEIFK